MPVRPRPIFALGLVAVAANPTLASGGSPNVIVVMTDDQGYGEFACHGNPLVESPHVDALHARSVRLTDFHVAPMCTPTRGQFLTGLDAFRNGAVNVSAGRSLLEPGLRTIADVFRDAGYRTALFGKWHVGDTYPFRPTDRGFDEAVWFPSSHINSVPDFWENDYFDDVYILGTRRERFEGYCTDVFFDEAIDWIGGRDGRDDDRPFFAYIATNAAHGPHFVAEEYRDRVRSWAEKNPGILDAIKNPRTREKLVSFLAMGADLDDNVGRLTAFLDDTGLRRDTVVVFMTDNGSTFGWSYYNAGMRGSKKSFWEGGHRVPCLVSGPKELIGRPRDVDTLSHVQDLLPTLAELAGIEHAPPGLDGTSLAPLFRGEPTGLDDRVLVIAFSPMPMKATDTGPDARSIPRREDTAVLWRRWRFLNDRALYDLRTDPGQRTDVAADHPDVVAKLRGRLDEWWSRVRDDALRVRRVVIGHDAENPATLTACEWLDVFVDQQKQVRRAVRKNGTWHVDVAAAGTYRFTAGRYPAEADVALTDGLPEVVITDGTYEAGPALAIAEARLEVAEATSLTTPVEPDAENVSFTLTLDAGPTELRATFLDAAGAELCGAYYLTAERL